MPIQLKRGKTSQIDKEIMLLYGQPGVEFRDGLPPRMKIGDGEHVWRELPYMSPDPEIYGPVSLFSNLNYSIEVSNQLSITGAGNTIYRSARHRFIGMTDGDEATAANDWMAINETGVYTNPTAPLSLGTTTNPWSAVYAKTGTIQTSDEASKGNIRYIEASTTRSESSELTKDDVIDFVRKLNPATFCYRHSDGSCDESLSDDCEIQLGLIANELLSHKAYKYVGVKAVDEEGQTHLGLQALPLTVAALTACKELLQEVDNLKAEVAELKAATA